MEMKTVPAMKNQPYNQLFYGREANVTELLKVLAELPDEMPIGWQQTSSMINSGICIRTGYYYAKEESFTDFFDRTTYYTKVWYHSKEATDSTFIKGIEFRFFTGLPSPSTEYPFTILETVADLKNALLSTDTEVVLFAPSENFELGGSLTPTVRFTKQTDETDRDWLILAGHSH